MTDLIQDSVCEFSNNVEVTLTSQSLQIHLRREHPVITSCSNLTNTLFHISYINPSLHLVRNMIIMLMALNESLTEEEEALLISYNSVKFPCTYILVMCLIMTTRNWCNCCIMEETNYNQHSYAYQLHPSPFSEKYNNNVNGTEWESETFDKQYMKLSSTVTTSPVSESQPAQVPH